MDRARGAAQGFLANRIADQLASARGADRLQAGLHRRERFDGRARTGVTATGSSFAMWLRMGFLTATATRA
ncbi:MAG: hypothetical protein AB1773_08785 [Pseudomonadota bacterium]